jgi:hypothetical protein
MDITWSMPANAVVRLKVYSSQAMQVLSFQPKNMLIPKKSALHCTVKESELQGYDHHPYSAHSKMGAALE